MAIETNIRVTGVSLPARREGVQNEKDIFVDIQHLKQSAGVYSFGVGRERGNTLVPNSLDVSRNHLDVVVDTSENTISIRQLSQFPSLLIIPSDEVEFLKENGETVASKAFGQVQYEQRSANFISLEPGEEIKLPMNSKWCLTLNSNGDVPVEIKSKGDGSLTANIPREDVIRASMTFPLSTGTTPAAIAREAFNAKLAMFRSKMDN
jgi:hypothetical protein